MAVVAALTITELLSKIKPLAKAAESIAKLAGKIGIGGVTDDRFIRWRDQVFTWFKDYGYGAHNDPKYAPLVAADKIGHSQVPNRKTSGNYSAEFQNLRKYVIDRLNRGNPGLGTVFGVYFPSIPMADLGGPAGQFFEALELVLKTFPPNSYQGGDLPMPEKTVTPPYASTPDLTQSKLAAGIAGAGTTASALSGIIGAIKGSNEVATQPPQNESPKLSLAGFNNMTIIVVVILLIIGTWLYTNKN